MTDIEVVNARTHNLRNVNLTIPRNKLVVFTGLSGSGKSSLVFNTLYAEAQRQFINLLSTLAQRYLPHLDRPAVDEVRGLSPAVVVQQRKLGNNPRSTVGTFSEIYTYLRLLYSRFGWPQIGDSSLFSFNRPEGACPKCKGLGEEVVVDKDKLVDWEKSLAEGAIRHPEYRPGARRWRILKLTGLFEMEKKLKDFTAEELNKLLYSPPIKLRYSNLADAVSFEGVVVGIERRRLSQRGTTLSSSDRDGRFFTTRPCSLCHGQRVNQRARSVKLQGKTFGELGDFSLEQLRGFLETIHIPAAQPIIEKALDLLDNLIEVGLGYLSLNRSVSTLSGGEAQRLKLAKQLGNSLIELIYVLDEPSIGLHSHDVSKLVKILKRLVRQGNSVLVIEHDPQIIKEADLVIELGPGAGKKGGQITFQGQVQQLLKSNSLTGQMLAHRPTIKHTPRPFQEFFFLKNVSLHNLRNVSVKIPKRVLTCVTGVAGAGKSSLILDTFAQVHPESIVIDQSPVGRSIRSNVATYVNVFNPIRRLFSQATGKPVSFFSFNSQGACPKCKGLGYQQMEMHFLGNVKLRCDLCHGRRYKQEVLRLLYQGKNIADILEMTVDEALPFFKGNKDIREKLSLLQEVGLGYLTLGQPTSTLSGGETQRIKITKELSKRGNIYILDEPTTGLHMADVRKLIKVLDRLVEAGNTVIVIEHNLEVIAAADWIIDLGPEGGEKGGKIVAEGRVEDIMKAKKSLTGRYLKGYLGR